MKGLKYLNYILVVISFLSSKIYVAYGILRRTSPILHGRIIQSRLTIFAEIKPTGDSDDISESENVLSGFTNIASRISFPNLVLGSVIGSVATILGVFLPSFYSPTVPVFGADGNADSKSLVSADRISQQVALFGNVLYDLENGYVDKVDPTKLFATAVSAMLKTLDPYTEFEDTKAATSLQESVSGKYGGVGMVISNSKDRSISVPKALDSSKLPKSVGPEKPLMVNNAESGVGVVVADPFEGYAYDAGLRVGDRIVAIDGVDTRSMNVEYVRNLLRGDPDTSVKIRFERNVPSDPSNIQVGSPQTSEVTVTRRLVQVSDVRLATLLGPPEAGIGYISLSGFNSAAGRDFRTAMLMLRFTAPNDLKGLVLDLRGNPGGLLDAAVEVSSYLLPAKSDVVSSKGRVNRNLISAAGDTSTSNTEVVYRSNAEPIRPPGMRLVVMVDGGSASAAEIVSGAVQDLDAGVIVGPGKTYGKGLVQKVSPLPFDAALKYTVARYYTPSGRCIQSVEYKGGREGNTLSAVSDKGESRGSADSTNSNVFSSIDAKEINDADRKTFFTRLGRPVRDGGGIEPDIYLPPNTVGPAEKALLLQGIFSDFATYYLSHEQASASVASSSWSSSAPAVNAASAASGGLRALMAAVAADERSSRAADERFQSVASINGLSQYFVQEAKYLPAEVSRVASTASMEKLFKAAAPAEAKAGPRSSFGLFDVARISADDIFREFKAYLKELMTEKKLSIDSAVFGSVSDAKSALAETPTGIFKDVSKALTDAGLSESEVSSEIERLKAKVRTQILANLDARRDDIVDDIEFSLLSRELPDRLLLYRAINRDPQVQAAVTLVQGEVLNTGYTLSTATASASTSAASIASSPSASVTTAGAGAGAASVAATGRNSLLSGTTNMQKNLMQPMLYDAVLQPVTAAKPENPPDIK